MVTRVACLIAAALPLATPALANPLVLKPLLEARLRYEHVEQGGLPDDADAITLRVRPGVTASSGHFTLLAQSVATLAILPDYFDGLNGKARYPLVGDPQNIQLDRLQLSYAGRAAQVTVGRQRIELDDGRFVAAASWRDNGQSFDALRSVIVPVKGVKLDATYAWNVRTFWGFDGNALRPQTIGGDKLFLDGSVVTPIGALNGFAYLVDQNVPSQIGFSSQTYGGRLTRAIKLTKVKVSYAASVARQSDWRTNPKHFAATYLAGDIAVERGSSRLAIGFEQLGASDGRALTSFQTPLATLHKFNGWADKFTVTPPDGLRDLYASATVGQARLGALKQPALTLVYHDFASDRNARRYGNEIDVQAVGKLGRTLVLVKYADYWAKSLATDTRKLWLSLEWSL